MPVSIDSKKFYLTSEACALAGISRDTFLRWVRVGSFPDVKHRDFRGWRLFTDDDLTRLKAKLNRIATRE
jgi:DNA-binding transcriptional MerR regulator